MRDIIIALSLFTAYYSFGQWNSIPQTGNFNTAYQQFIINPYTNNIWLNAENKVSVIENDGTIRNFDTASGELETMWVGSELRFAFTPNDVYCASRGYGLRLFTNYTAQSKFNFSEYQGVVRFDGDTVFVLSVDVSGNNRWVVFTENQTNLENKIANDMISKNGFEYAINGSVIQYTTPPSHNILYNDSYFLQALHNDMKFTRLSDTLYIAGELGISKAYNYDFFDTITPYNTTNMPSPNILEIEFDHLDNLWAVFGNDQGEAISLAMLDGSNWTNSYDSNNSPINFSEFYGMEIDTLGNVWVNDEDYLHVLESPNNPEWLNMIEETHSFLSIFPNPSSGIINLSTSEISTFDKVELLGLDGKLIRTYIPNEQIDLGVESGVYLIQLRNKNEIIASEKIIIQL